METFYTLFFILNIQNPKCILYLQHISTQAERLSRVQWLHVASGWVLDRKAWKLSVPMLVAIGQAL